MEMVRRLADLEPGQGRQPPDCRCGVVGVGVDAGPDGGAAERHAQQLVARGPRPPDGLLELARVAAELLAQADRGRVLEVGPARLDDRPELVGLGIEGGPEDLEGRQERVGDRHRRRQLERRRDHVVRRLALVHVVVGMDLLRTAGGRQALGREVGDDLVHVRVRRRARAGLVDVDRELVVVAAVRDLGRAFGDGARDLAVEQAELRVRLRCRLLDQRERPDERPGEALPGDREVQDGPLGRGAVQCRGGNVHRAHRVALDPGRRARFGRHGPIVGGRRARTGSGGSLRAR